MLVGVMLLEVLMLDVICADDVDANTTIEKRSFVNFIVIVFGAE